MADANNTPAALTLTVDHVDAMMDLTADICRNPTMRMKAMDRAMGKGLPFCECCGKAITNPAKSAQVVDPAGELLGTFGPECYRKAVKLLAAG